MDDDLFYVGMAARARMRVFDIDPISGLKTPNSSVPEATIRFRDPNSEVLAELTLGSGVINGGDGYYYATAVPEEEGLHIVEFETEGANPGRDKTAFNVEPF